MHSGRGEPGTQVRTALGELKRGLRWAGTGAGCTGPELVWATPGRDTGQVSQNCP